MTDLLQRILGVLNRYLGAYLALSAEERVLTLFILAIILFTIVSAAFALYALLVHLSRKRNDERWEALVNVWTNSLLDVLSGDRLVPDLLAEVPKGEELRFLNFLSLYSRRLRGFELQQLWALAAPFLDGLSSRLHDREPERRARALKTAAELGFSRFADEIRAAMEDESPLVRMIAARALVNYGDSTDLLHILDGLEGFSSWSTRYISALLAQRGEEIIEGLCEVYGKTDRSTFARAAASRALLELNAAESVEVARAVLEEPIQTDTHVAGLELIRAMGDSEAADVVKRLAKADNVIVRAHALSALGAVGSLEDEPTLVKGLEHSSPWVARHAAEGLIELGRVETLHHVAAAGGKGAVVAQQILLEEGE